MGLDARTFITGIPEEDAVWILASMLNAETRYKDHLEVARPNRQLRHEVAQPKILLIHRKRVEGRSWYDQRS